ncbi:hypothetical protein STRATTON_255 [Erwinia phage vB_EamM_Stratton]|uniref:Uncharacterized protein n=2 Tax=Erskinevirus EaH2 TaxID=2169883 RepID=A0A1B2IHB9_9CAUD|nr:hypothetical protein G173_gp153 [Erwinia phage phiEaH2]AFQ96698.1 hypothetical protein [Erwinia phage phiEaH2]ANZ50680.1 hypothetical protein STRATTON_255 [Erwinia phage vB_EamM_Stratton]
MSNKEQVQESQLAADPMDFGDIPGLDPDAGVVGGVDAAIEDDGCAGGACKI